MVRKSLSSFAIGGKTINTNKFAKEIGLEKVIKNSNLFNNKLHLDEQIAEKLNPHVRTVYQVAKACYKFNNKIKTSNIENSNNVLNTGTTDVPLIYTHIWKEPLVLKTNVHVGLNNSKRLKNMGLNKPDIGVVVKNLVNTKYDSDEAIKNQDLELISGFNQKRFYFFKEQSFLTKQDMKFFHESSFGKIVESLEEEDISKANFYSAIQSLKSIYKLRNTDREYTSKVKLHMCKLTEKSVDVQWLVNLITNQTIETEKVRNHLKKKQKNLQDFKPLSEDRDGDFLDKKKYKVDYADDYKAEQLKRIRTRLSNINETQLLDDPIQFNKFQTSFLTLVNTNLRKILGFKDEVKVLRTWNETLPPNSTWEFELTHTFQNGINLSKMMEDERLHLDHPMSYFFILEMQGPKNCLLRTFKNNVEHSKTEGTSPCSLYLEFRSYLKYVAQKPCSANNFEADTDTPTIYKYTCEGTDFSEDSELESIYHSERDKTFNVDYYTLKMDNDGVTYSIDRPGVAPTTNGNLLNELKDLLKNDGVEKPTDEDIREYNNNYDETPAPAEEPTFKDIMNDDKPEDIEEI